MVFVFALALCLGVNAIVPTGYMLDRDAEGAITMRICSVGLDQRFVTLDPLTGEWVETGEDGKLPGPDDDQQPSELCEFSLLTSHIDMPSQDLGMFAEVFGLPLLGGEIYVERPQEFVASTPLPARGPPLRA
ncbi:MAG: hypothetical protein CBB65_00910 [Hyphomonadaceae bacterium TMED5]|nr:hypothetical protein [Ponticaulis sp.]OUY01707.1 MAG: hypothetical protein CBB65_00910 [Hyphomonadaceae bacterium TMED5]|tara:strand:+ start:38032 stop:38427 length:396 start_codon:yes stop_codon:yes gene_type:complete